MYNRNALGLPNEFVLNENGTPLRNDSVRSLNDYLNYFSVFDIFQGVLGDCWLIAAIMGATRNKTLLAWLVPHDNALRAHMNVGVYHFRLWKLGEWFDVVVDDLLPVVARRHDLFFTRNLTYQNEFWISLFEKAVAK